MKIELIYDRECPNVEEARFNLKAALKRAGLNAGWREIDRNDINGAPYAANYGSPTILINGKDVYGLGSESAGNCCRVYGSRDGSLSKAPPIDILTQAIFSELHLLDKSRFLPAFSGTLGSLVALLPAVFCPACWPAYAGLLSSLGVGFFNYLPYLTPLTFLLLLIAVWALWYRARTRHGYGPFVIGLLGAALILIDRIGAAGPSFLYTGIILLAASSIWNARSIAPAT